MFGTERMGFFFGAEHKLLNNTLVTLSFVVAQDPETFLRFRLKRLFNVDKEMLYTLRH